MSATIGIVLFGISLMLSWINSSFHVALPDRPLYSPSPRIFQGAAPKGRVLPVALAALPFTALTVLFVLDIARVWVGIALFVAMLAIRRAEIVQWKGDIVVRLGKYVPTAACLLAWLVAQPALLFAGYAEEEARVLGWDAACGVMAGAYVLAGIAKLRESGVQWAESKYQALLVAERAFAGPAIVRSTRLAVARSRFASRIVGIAGLATEFLAIGLVVPVLRPIVVALVLVLHAGFVVLLGYAEYEWVVVIVSIVLMASGA